MKKLVICFIMTCFNMLASVQANELNIKFIDVKFFSQENGEFLEYPIRANAYGLDMQLIVQVIIEGKDIFNESSLGTPRHNGTLKEYSASVTLDVSANGWEDEATGSHDSWVLQKKSTFMTMPETSKKYILFTVPYADCYADVNLTATLAYNNRTTKKTRKISLACAE